jgi:uncharacterized membrane protein (UPF0127 family)
VPLDLDLDQRRLRWFLWVALGVLGLGLWFFVLRGADQPADPSFEDEGTTTSAPAGAGGDPATEPTATTASPAAPEVAPPGDPGRTPFGGFDEVAIAVDPGDGGDLLTWCLLAARTAAQRAQGMIGVTDLQGYDGMAFLYPEDVQNQYHMRGVPEDLSIAWLDAEGGVVTIRDMVACPDADPGCATYAPTGPYRYSIEVFRGRLDELGIDEDATVTFTGPCVPAGAG